MILSTEQAAQGRVRVYRNVSIVNDGPPVDIAIEGARVVGIGSVPENVPNGTVEVDATGLELRPGIINIVPTATPSPDSVLSGITTQVVETDPSSPSVGNTMRVVPLDELAHSRAPAQALAAALDGGAWGMSSSLSAEAMFDQQPLPADVQGSPRRELLRSLVQVLSWRSGLWIATQDGIELEALRQAYSLAETYSLRPGPVLVELGNQKPTIDMAQLGIKHNWNMIHRVSLESNAVSASRMGLLRGDIPRGQLQIGAAADLVLSKPVLNASGRVNKAPTRIAPELVVEVLVGGVPVVSDGKLTGATPGEALKSLLPGHRSVVPSVAFEIDSAKTPNEGPQYIDSIHWFARTFGLKVDDPELAAAAEVFGKPDYDDGECFPGIVTVATSVDPSLPEEGFRVHIGKNGFAVTGGSKAGIFYGLTVLSQLQDSRRGDHAPPLPFGTCSSAPTHAHRGLMIDVARHFRPVEDVCRIIDLMAKHRLNVFHFHLTDDQGWRYEVPGWPLCTEVGSKRSKTQLGHGPKSRVEPIAHSGFYTAADIAKIVAYAKARFVRIIPEVEFPGHVQALLAAYPELGNGDAAPMPTEPWPNAGLNPHTINLEPSTLEFCKTAIDALIALFPDSDIIGIGGDEVPVGEWEASAAARKRMADLGIPDAHAIQPWITNQLCAHVTSRGKTPHAWDEVLAGPVPAGTVIAAWRGHRSATVSLARGHPTIACPDLEAYLDYRQGDSADEPVPIGPPLTLEGAWQLRVPEGCIGGQANIWTEHLQTREQLDYAAFPRLCAIAERLWVGGEPGDFAEFERRMDSHYQRLGEWGVAYRSPDGPRGEQRKPGVHGNPRTRAFREAALEELCSNLIIEDIPPAYT